MRECCWVTQNTGKAKNDLITHTHPASSGEGWVVLLIFLVFFFLRKPWIRGWGQGVRRPCDVDSSGQQNVCPLVAGQAGGEAPLLPSFSYFCYWVQAEGCCRAVGGLSWDFPLMPSACGHFPYSPLNFHHSAGSKLRPWEANPTKWHPGWELQWSLSSLTVQGSLHRPIPVHTWDRCCSKQTK